MTDDDQLLDDQLLVGMIDVADRLGYPVNTVYAWRARRQMPDPCAAVCRGQVPLWRWSDVKLWALRVKRVRIQYDWAPWGQEGEIHLAQQAVPTSGIAQLRNVGTDQLLFSYASIAPSNPMVAVMCHVIVPAQEFRPYEVIPARPVDSVAAAEVAAKHGIWSLATDGLAKLAER